MDVSRELIAANLDGRELIGAVVSSRRGEAGVGALIGESDGGAVNRAAGGVGDGAQDAACVDLRAKRRGVAQQHHKAGQYA